MGSESPGYCILKEGSSTQMTERDLFILKQTRDAGTKTEEELISLETTRVSSSQTSEEENGSLEFLISGENNSDFTSKTSEEKRKRTLSSEDDTDAYKRSRPINSGVDNVKKSVSGDDIIPLPCTPWGVEDDSSSKLCQECVQSVSPLELQPSVNIKKKRSRIPIATTCSHCKSSVSEQVIKEDGKKKYRCCGCGFIRRDNFSYLMIHVYNDHIRNRYCYACQMNYSNYGTHAPKQTCIACNQNFDCKEIHYFSDHEEFNKTHCRICKEEYSKNFSEEAKINQCCVCEYLDENRSMLVSHLFTQFLLRIYECEVCLDHFKRSSIRETNILTLHPLCKLSKKRFLNTHFLYQHIREEHREE